MSEEKAFTDAFIRATGRARFRRRERGLLGRRNADNTYTYIPPDRPDRVYVRVWRGGSLTLATAYNSAVSLSPDLPVVMERTSTGELEIIGTDTERAAAYGGGRLPSLSVPPHEHGLSSGNVDYVEALRLTPGLVVPNGLYDASAGYDMRVYIYPWFYQHEGADMNWGGGTLDLTAYRPATAGHWWWCKVGIDPATNAAVAVADTVSQFTLTALTRAQLAAIDLGEAIPLAGVKLRTGQTATMYLSSDPDQSDYMDCRPWITSKIPFDDFMFWWGALT